MNLDEYRRYIRIFTQDIGPRTLDKPQNIEAAQSFIESTLGYDNMGYRVVRHEFERGGRKFAHLEVEVTGKSSPDKTVLVTARYDGDRSEDISALMSLGDKGALPAEHILMIDEKARVVGKHDARPSDESLLHIRVVNERGAGAVLHTHSIWSTMLSDLHAERGGLAIEGYEMLKGLAGVKTHEHREWLPVLENSQNMPALADHVAGALSQHRDAHGFLLRRHGLYTWGKDLAQAKRHVEILEFLLETVGRSRSIAGTI